MSPTAERGGGGRNPASTRFLLAGAWHAQAEAAHGQMWALITCLRMALLQAKMEVEVGMVARELGSVARAHDHLVQQYLPQRLTAAALDGNFGGEKQSSKGSTARSSAGDRGV